jgi:DNA-binding IscR family transcriptional regulator
MRLETLARNQRIPLRYLAKIAQDLKRAGRSEASGGPVAAAC